MSNTIQVKRGANASLSTLNSGEFGFSTDSHQVYIGDGATNHELVTVGVGMDDRYYTESEVDTISGSLQTNIDGKSDTAHLHDDRYYTESEVDDLITTISGNLDSHASNHTDGTDDIQSATNAQKGLATASQITDIESNTAHKTSTGEDHSYIDQSVVSGTSPIFIGTNITEIPSENVHFDTIGSPTYETAQDWFDVIQSAGILDGFVLSNSRAAIELDVSAGKGIIKETDSKLGATVSFETGAVEDVTLTADNINYIYVDYNSGTPQIVATTDRALIEYNRMFIIGRVYKNGTDLHILNAGVSISNLARTEHERLVERDGFTYTLGSVTSETGTLNLDITAGVWYLGHNRITTADLNSDTGGDTWVYTHYGAASWITDNPTVSGVDCTHYNDGTDVLGTLGPNNYGTQWVYITADNYWYIIYGTQNGQLVTAENDLPPSSVPIYIETMGELIAKMIVRQDGTIVDIQSVHDITFTTAGIANHNETGGIQGGDANEYYHLTSDEHTDLTDGGDSTSHKHDDRYYTESEVDTISGSLQTNIDGKSDTSHLHDDRYYTESEVDTISGSLNTKIGDNATTLIGLSDTPSSYDDDKYLKSTTSGIDFVNPTTIAYSGEDIILKMGDSSGANKISIKDYGDNEVGSIDSDGIATFSKITMVDNQITRPELLDYSETVNALGDLGGGTDDIDLTLGNVVTATVSTSAETFTFSNPPASSKNGSFTLILINGGSQTVNWPASVDWTGGTAPSLIASGTDIIVFTTLDAGTTWYGLVGALDIK